MSFNNMNPYIPTRANAQFQQYGPPYNQPYSSNTFNVQSQYLQPQFAQQRPQQYNPQLPAFPQGANLSTFRPQEAPLDADEMRRRREQAYANMDIPPPPVVHPSHLQTYTFGQDMLMKSERGYTEIDEYKGKSASEIAVLMNQQREQMGGQHFKESLKAELSNKSKQFVQEADHELYDYDDQYTYVNAGEDLTKQTADQIAAGRRMFD